MGVILFLEIVADKVVAQELGHLTPPLVHQDLGFVGHSGSAEPSLTLLLLLTLGLQKLGFEFLGSTSLRRFSTSVLVGLCLTSWAGVLLLAGAALPPDGFTASGGFWGQIPVQILFELFDVGDRVMILATADRLLSEPV